MLATDHVDMHDAGPRASGAERFCVVARRVLPIAELLRFVAGPDGTVVPDIKRKLPGRGVWVTASRAAIAEAVKCGAFKRGLKANVDVPSDLPDLVDRLLVRASLDALAIAHKAGQVIAGFERVEGALAAGSLAALIHATDAAPDGVRKIHNFVMAGRQPTSHALDAPTAPRNADAGNNRGPAVGGGEDAGVNPPIPVIRAFTSSQLDLALGRSNVIHAALLGGREGDTFLTRWRTLERYRTNSGRGEPKRAGNGAVQPDAARNWERND